MSLYPIILSGGSGTRLWPLSRPHYPKQLLSLACEATMLQATVARSASDNFSPLIVTAEEHRFHVVDQLKAIGVTPAAILLEPEPRNTAAAIALAAESLAATDSDAVMLVMPSDHVILDEKAFHDAVRKGIPAAKAGLIVTFGISPDRPETGYGYIESAQPLSDLPGVHSVACFTEKPDSETAQAYVGGGQHYWNSGIFLFTARTYLQQLELHAPAVASGCRAAMTNAVTDGHFVRPNRADFITSTNISIDHAVMEQTDKAAVVPVSMGWSDLGSWHSVWEIGDKDQNGNITKGDVVALDCHNNLFRSENGPTIAALGVSDLVVVSARDVVLVLPRDRAQDVRQLVNVIGASGRADALHAIVHRPWGTYETTDRGDRFQTKRIVVKPGQKLSLQLHHHRAEHWIVVSGTARVTINDEVSLLRENQSTYVPAGATHRLENPGHIPLHLIEVQCGPYLGEDDIVRLEDNYGRVE
ncbi:mannose-1-phosphate guanylyltransferase/mannose-6-phosphate isomerase [Sphingomonas sp. LaA6.9]|uniref:mannose-1-phosphate guanylyltransferase/mannose-6-phosphate isomerase n=1 Tax=Sphingomonas sp. LaA6.9 TaxID=2919914 RepID=UPI001F4F6DB9|nr:mannose-1-phosphate guanylyltransferase/mannose-6-phosphate isomerase [Sphingomonas sp. LaA6.9]MCJ8159782.1 mannose-1-phosphate guanylyltransferase/mannose-6-phosphate isomerase [Sphingomonas sp. LaA6.9]